MGCNQSTQRKTETTTAEPQQQNAVEKNQEPVEATAKDLSNMTATTDVIVASPVRATPASPSKIVATQLDLEPSLDHVAAEGPSEVPSQSDTPREHPVAVVAVIDTVLAVQPAADITEVAQPSEPLAPVETVAAVEEQPETKDVAQSSEHLAEANVEPQPEPVQVALSAAPVDEKKEASVPTVPVLVIPTSAAPVARKRSKTPAQRTTTASKTPAKTPSKTPSKTPAKASTNGVSKKPNDETVSRKVQFDKVPAQNPQQQRKVRARKAAGRHQGNVNEEMFLATVAAFERQLTHRGALDNQLNSR